MPFQMYVSSIFSEIISMHDVKPDPQKLKALMEMCPLKTKKDLQAFSGKINHVSKFSPNTADVCESLRQQTSSKAE